MSGLVPGTGYGGIVSNARRRMKKMMMQVKAQKRMNKDMSM